MIAFIATKSTAVITVMLASERRLCQNSFSTINALRRSPGSSITNPVPHKKELAADGGCCSQEQSSPTNCTAEKDTMIQRRRGICLVLRQSANDNFVASRVRHYVVEPVVVRIAHSDATVRGRAEEDAIPPGYGAPVWSHRSVNVNPSTIEFFYVQLVWAERIPSELRLAVRSVSG